MTEDKATSPQELSSETFQQLVEQHRLLISKTEVLIAAVDFYRNRAELLELAYAAERSKPWYTKLLEQ